MRTFSAQRLCLQVMLLRPLIFVPSFLWMRGAEETSDALKLLAMFLFAATNGYGGTLAMMYGPQQVELKPEREVPARARWTQGFR